MKVYNGSCHCGNIKYTVALDEALAPEGKGTINRCNCSICTKNGELLVILLSTSTQFTYLIAGYFLVYPRREDVVFQDGCDTRMKSYFFGKKLKPHRFCPECSSSILIDFKNSDVKEHVPLLAMNASPSADYPTRTPADLVTR